MSKCDTLIYNYNMRKTLLLALCLLVLAAPAQAKKKAPVSDREYWAQLAVQMAQPILENMARGELQKNMLTEFSPSFDNRNRKVVYMEAFGRLMAGLAPYIANGDDPQARQLREWALSSYKNAVDPQSPDYLC